ncbi:putative zinc- or iron-chelating protein [Mangrovibacterium marinum]|uniref:Putative zinc-or iron-chelating protein n=1 Tax=Mangrovibacterium marinum TaxID=1639118 RepID=A0A2T5C276_9BACT|nr:YkgJ family cysteine cluster protein [Mangrovibacterium marinum]PTN08802.1 putative zinc- or iron-chelating protein [Mangrovibacterium marinum]
MYRKVQRVQKVLKNAALHAEKFSHKSGLTCVANCHHCCLKTDISASPLEFLPLAYHLYKTGKAELFYDQLEKLPANTLCINFSPLGAAGACSEYAYRGLICRLFGYATNHDKQGHNRLVSCKTIKQSPTAALLPPKLLAKAPVMADYYMQLAAIDFKLGNEAMPINQAIKRALELVMTYYMYRGRGRRA